MFSKPTRPEIDERTTKLVIGIIALTMASVTQLFAAPGLTSISASYYQGGWSQSFFVGFLFSVSAFLWTYNGFSVAEMVAAKFAAVTAVGIALYPCGCGVNLSCAAFSESVSGIHFGCAAVLFGILAFFCYGFWSRAWKKPSPQAKARVGIYLACALGITGSILLLVVGFIHKSMNGLSEVTLFGDTRLIYHCEMIGLVSFGISWLTASRRLPLITSEDERR